MKKAFVQIFTLIYPAVVLAMTCKQYQVDLNMENKVTVTRHAALEQGPSSNPGDCSLMCNHGCSVFGFNVQTKWCRTYASVDLDDMTGEESGWRYYRFDEKSTCDVYIQRDCHDYHRKGIRKSGVYDLRPFDNSSLSVKTYCIMTNEAGWTVIQRRNDNTTDFYRSWEWYKTGFGDRNGNYWIGNDAIHALTKHLNQKLRVELQATQNGVISDANYYSFSIGDEASNYRLLVNGYSGTAGDGFYQHTMAPFSTYDRDNDAYGGSSAAEYFEGAWWYYEYRYSDLNALNILWNKYQMKSTMMISRQ